MGRTGVAPKRDNTNSRIYTNNTNVLTIIRELVYGSTGLTTGIRVSVLSLMIYLLYGPDTYRSRAKLNELISAFSKKQGGELGITRIDFKDQADEPPGLHGGGTLFSKARLIIIENVSASSAEVRKEILERSKIWAKDQHTFVIFREENIDQPNGKFIAGLRDLAAKSQEFKALAPARIFMWLESEAKKRGVKISSTDQRTLVRLFGSDLWRLSNELEKMRCGASLEASLKQEEKVWNFTDNFLADRRSSLPALTRLIEDGFEPVYLIGALTGALRIMALVWYGLISRRLAPATKNLHPFVVKKNTELARGLSSQELARHFILLLDTDVRIKTGKLTGPLSLLKLILHQL